MKKPPSRHRSSKSVTIPVRHQFDHAVPTVMHHPEEKMTALGRWAHHVVKEPKKYATRATLLVAGALVLYGVWHWTTAPPSKTSEVWELLKEAKTPEDRLAVARKHPDSLASMWTMLQVASDNYNLGLADMPHNRDVALQSFKKAQALYDELVERAPANSYLARAALMGKARTLEARNERAEAIKQYELIASKWEGSPEAAQALEMAAALRKPQAADFYKDLYAFAPRKVTLPPLSSELIDSPLRSAPGKSTTPSKSTVSPLDTLPDLPLVFPPSPEDEKKSAAAKPAGTQPELPANVFTTKPAPGAKEKAPR